MQHTSLFTHAPDIVPERLERSMTACALVEYMGRTSFEARNVWQAVRVLRAMLDEDDTVWLGIAGAGIAGGMGGGVLSLLESGFVDVICSTGAQVYHDLHFAFGLPVKRISPRCDDDELRRRGDTRIFDIGIRERETLMAQDSIIREFVKARHARLDGKPLSTWEFNHALGAWAAETAPHPERSFVVAAAKAGVPVFWDSHTNHSIAMNLVQCERDGLPVRLSAQRDIIESAAIVYAAGGTGFLELGGGGPKNFIQQTGPTLSQILNMDFEGADRGVQIGTAVEREGSLSGCTFGEAVTWGKYKSADEAKLVQIWGEYSIIFPLLAACLMEACTPRPQKRLVDRMPALMERLEAAL